MLLPGAPPPPAGRFSQGHWLFLPSPIRRRSIVVVDRSGRRIKKVPLCNVRNGAESLGYQKSLDNHRNYVAAPFRPAAVEGSIAGTSSPA